LQLSNKAITTVDTKRGFISAVDRYDYDFAMIQLGPNFSFPVHQKIFNLLALKDPQFAELDVKFLIDPTADPYKTPLPSWKIALNTTYQDPKTLPDIFAYAQIPKTNAYTVWEWRK